MTRLQAALQRSGMETRKQHFNSYAGRTIIHHRWARFMDPHPEQVAGCTLPARRNLGAAEETVPSIRGTGRACRIHARRLHRSQGPDGAGMRGLVRVKCEPGSPTRVSTVKRPTQRVEPEPPWLRRPGLSDAAKAGEPAYPLGPHSVRPLRRLAGGYAPSDPRAGNGAP